MTRENSMKFSGKMCLKITLKFTKNQGFFLSLEHTLFKKPQGSQTDQPPPAVLGLNFVKILNFFVQRCLTLMELLEEMVIRVTLLAFVTKDF